MSLPKLLILDDLFGRNVPHERNRERENLCAHFLWRDITGDSSAEASQQNILFPTADAVFHRAQKPTESGIGAQVENDLESTMHIIRKGWGDTMQRCEASWAMVLLDLCFYTGKVTVESHRRTPGMPCGHPKDDDPTNYFGLVLLESIHSEFPDLPVMILSSKPREEVSLEFSQRGALGFIARDDLHGQELLHEALWQHGLLPDSTGEVIGNSLPLLLALREARRAARHEQNILIRGERGTGKELLARYLHRAATNQEKLRPFVPVNSAIFTPSLFASELFGIEAKTATNVNAKIGLIETANGGDLFLDEVADMPVDVQASLLRVLQERQITRVGGLKHIPLDVRFISATNVKIDTEKSEFRTDLLDRLRLGGTIWLPPLRDRKSDIPLLVNFFIQEAENNFRGSMHRKVTGEALARLCDYEWPGNIRELRSCISDAVNRYPHVEHLVVAHLRFMPMLSSEMNNKNTGTKYAFSVNDHHVESIGCDLESLLNVMGQCIFPAKEIENWTGQFDKIQLEYSRFLARYLQAALDATKRRTPSDPHGQIQIHPAVKLMTGNTMLTASQAADVVKRVLSPIKGGLECDLAKAYSVALRLRPRSSRTNALGDEINWSINSRSIKGDGI